MTLWFDGAEPCPHRFRDDASFSPRHVKLQRIFLREQSENRRLAISLQLLEERAESFNPMVKLGM